VKIIKNKGGGTGSTRSILYCHLIFNFFTHQHYMFFFCGSWFFLCFDITVICTYSPAFTVVGHIQYIFSHFYFYFLFHFTNIFLCFCPFIFQCARNSIGLPFYGGKAALQSEFSFPKVYPAFYRSLVYC